MKCPKCNGVGSTQNFGVPDYCLFCDGKHNLDWIEYLFGVNNIREDTCPLCGRNMVNYESYPYIWDNITKKPKVDEYQYRIPDKTKPKIKVPRCLKCGVFI